MAAAGGAGGDARCPCPPYPPDGPPPATPSNKKPAPAGWTTPDFSDRDWPAATVLYKAERFENRRDPASPYGLVPRMIPALEEGAPADFRDVFSPGGGDAPGLNAVIRAVVLAAHQRGWQCYGIRRGFGGLLGNDGDRRDKDHDHEYRYLRHHLRTFLNLRSKVFEF